MWGAVLLIMMVGSLSNNSVILGGSEPPLQGDFKLIYDPLVFPEPMEKATEIITGTLRDLWGEEIAWRMGIRNFLDNNSTVNEECMRGRWRG